MRLDKFLKVSRLIKRRTLAKEVADQGRITVNGKCSESFNRPLLLGIRLDDPIRAKSCHGK